VTIAGEVHFEDPPGATPLDDDDVAGLIPTWVATRGDLDTAEQENILTAMVWAFTARRRWSAARILDRQTLADLHRRMFGEVWQWAGSWRQREANVGVSPRQVVTELENLLGDVQAQTADPARLAWPPDEVAVRFHHRLVLIHSFPNGNGRHARLAADLLVVALRRPRFTWGAGGDLSSNTSARGEYLSALRTADRDYDFAPLLRFARS